MPLVKRDANEEAGELEGVEWNKILRGTQEKW